MNRKSKIVLGTVIAAGVVLSAMFAFAAGGHGGHGGHGMGHGMHGGDGFGHVYGEITAIDGDKLTITPSIPDFFKDKLGEHGVHIDIELPATAVVTITGDTTFYVNGAEAAFDDFGVGDMIMAVGKDDGSFNITANHVADPASLKEHMEGMHDKFKGEHCEGHDGHPLFGEITKLDAKGVTIKPEIPAFMKEMIENHHDKMRISIDLPESVTLAWAEDVHFMVAGELVEDNPFKVGDKVGMMVQGKFNEGTGVVLGMGDYATAQMRVGEMKEKAHGKHGEMGCGHGGHGDGHGGHGMGHGDH